MTEIGYLPQDGAYGSGVWLQVGAKFGLVALVGVLRFLVYRGGKHVLSTFVRKTITTIPILANYYYLSDIDNTFLIDIYCTILFLVYYINTTILVRYLVKRYTH